MSGPDGILPAAGSGPGELPEVDTLAAVLRADTADLETYARVVFSTLADALPEGVVEIERDRSVAERLGGKPGRVRALRIRLGELSLSLEAGRHGLSAGARREVRGVAISNRAVPLEEWTRLLATELRRLAAESADARRALGRLLGAE